MSRSTILLVDEVKILQEVLKEFLRLSPVRVLTAERGAAALELAQRERPDLIVMDVNMPVMDGLTHCALIKGDHALKATPVIMLTGSADPATVAMCRRAGCDGILTKPVLGRSFLNVLHSFIPAIERRKPRIHCRVPVSVRTGGAVLSGESRDIGMGGLYVATEGDVAKDSEVVVSFRVPAKTYALTVIRGRVAWVNAVAGPLGKEEPKGFGVEFQEIIGEGLNRLRFSELSAYINGHDIPV